MVFEGLAMDSRPTTLHYWETTTNYNEAWRLLFFARLCFPSLPNTNSQVLIPNSCALAKIHKRHFWTCLVDEYGTSDGMRWGYCEHVYLCYQLVQPTDDSEQSAMIFSLRIHICPKISGFPLYSYSGAGIETINPTLGRGMDPQGLYVVYPDLL